MLTDAEMLWILDYANNVQIARDITRIMTDSKAAGLDMTETARALKAELSSYTPSEFAKRFGEEKYWKLVNHNATFRTKSYATINQLDFAGVKEYQWITRGAEACPICVPYDNKIFNVSDAKGRMTAYFDAAKEGSVINMQKADPFLDLDEALLNPDGIMGMMPPIHHWCYCEIVIYYTNEVQPEEPKPEEKEPTKEEIDNYLRNNVDIRMREELRRQFKANPELISKILKNNPSLKFKLDKISIEHAKYSRKHNEITFRKKEFIEQRALKHEVGHSFDKLSPLGKTITSDYLDVQNAFNKDKIQIIDKVKSNPEGFQKAMKSDPKYTDGIQDTIDSMIYDSDLKVKTLFGHEPKYWNYKEQLSLNNVKYDIYLKKNGELFADYYELRQNGSIAGLNTYTELFPELSKVLDKWYKTL
jgi:hypothetical protein